MSIADLRNVIETIPLELWSQGSGFGSSYYPNEGRCLIVEAAMRKGIDPDVDPDYGIDQTAQAYDVGFHAVRSVYYYSPGQDMGRDAALAFFDDETKYDEGYDHGDGYY